MIDEKRLIKECEDRLLVGTSVIKLIEEQPKICEWILLEEKTPENGEHVLLSFANEKQKPLVGIWKVDDEGGAFYAPFTGRTYASLGYFVSAWMPLLEPYEENAPKKKADITPVIDWIPCSERLPDKSDFYMACVYNGDTYDYRKNWFYHEDDYGDSEWVGLISYEKVIAWTLLPEPYKPKNIKEAPWKNRALGDFMKGANR